MQKEVAGLNEVWKRGQAGVRIICNHSIFRHDDFIGCFSADKIKKSVRK